MSGDTPPDASKPLFNTPTTTPKSGLSLLESLMQSLGPRRKLTRAWRKIYTAAVVGQVMKEVRDAAELEAAAAEADHEARERQLKHEHAVSKCTSLISKFEEVGVRVVFDSWLRQTEFLRSQDAEAQVIE